MTTRPKLLVLSSTYPRWPNDSEPAFVHELSRRLAETFEVSVVCPACPGAAYRENMDGVDVRRFHYAPGSMQTLVNHGGIVSNLNSRLWKWLLVPFFLLAELWAVIKALREIRPDVVHAHWIVPQGFVISLISLVYRSSPPFVATSHGSDLHALRFWPMPALKQFVFKRAAVVTVVSSAMLDSMKAQGISHEGAKVEPMGVDLEDLFAPGDADNRSSYEILFVGRLVEVKGLCYLIEAMPLILGEYPEARLTVAGFGPEEQALRKQASGLGIIDKVSFLGAVPQSELPALYRRAAVFVAPFIETSRGEQEGLGLVTVEAVGCGCPVVVSDLPAVGDVIEEPQMKTPPADSTALAAKVLEMLQMPAQDRQRLAAGARQRLLEKFSWGARAKSYADLLKKIAMDGR